MNPSGFFWLTVSLLAAAGVAWLLWGLDGVDGPGDNRESASPPTIAVLSGFDLTSTTLGVIRLPRTDLRFFSWEDVYIAETDLSWSDLRGSSIERSSVRGANLTHADLSDASLKGSDLRGACLRSAVLRRADLRGADLSGADLSGADLRGAIMDAATVLRDLEYDGETFWPDNSPAMPLEESVETGSCP